MRAPAVSESEQRFRNLPQRFRRHEPQALADLYDLYGELLYVLVKGIVKKPKVIDLLVQECFLRAWNNANELEETLPSVGLQLLRIARQCASDYLTLSDAGAMPVAVPQFPIEAIKREHPLSQAQLIEDGIKCLSKAEKRVVNLSFYQGLSPVAIADQLHEPIEKVEESAKAAKSRLMAKLDRYLLDLIVE